MGGQNVKMRGTPLEELSGRVLDKKRGIIYFDMRAEKTEGTPARVPARRYPL
jgi:hypothetical protein